MELQAEHPVRISNPDKVLWPNLNITKLDYLHYLIKMSPWMLPHLYQRAITVIRFPDGIDGHSFYQKDVPQGAPEWLKTVPIWSSDRDAYIHYVLADTVASLLWLGNLACLEFHVGFATIANPDWPTTIAFDLDPTVVGFEPVREVALTLHQLLLRLELPHVAKTSGATGLQVFIPLEPGHQFDQTRIFTEAVARYLESKLPRLVTLERLKKHRGNKVYVDYLQHGQGRTLIAPYSARATAFATVSAPVSWAELGQGCVPADFTVQNMPLRLQTKGDLLAFDAGVKLQPLIDFLTQHDVRRL